MNDVLKKRLTGLVILIAIAILIPLVMTQCGHDAGDQAGQMRVYTIQPDGQVESVAKSQNGATSGNRQASQKKKSGAKGQPSNGQTTTAFTTPPVKGGTGETAARSQTRQPAGTEKKTAQTAREKPQTPAGSERKSGANSPPRETAKSEPSTTRKAAPDGADESRVHGWVVQVASFAEVSNAKSLAGDLSGKFHASYSRVSVNGKTYYHVYVGPFDAEGAARTAAEKLSKAGHGALVRNLP